MELSPPSGGRAIETAVVSGAGLMIMTAGDSGNRLSPVLLSELSAAVLAHENNPDVHFLILRSRGSHFCLGMDLEAFLANSDQTAFETEIRAYADLLTALDGCRKTTVAVVEGAVKAGGVGLVAACDIAVASDNVVFELSEGYLGLIPANVMPFLLTKRISQKRAAYLVQSAAPLVASEAKILGLVDEVHPTGDMEKAVRQIGRRLARISPEATETYKAFIAKIQDLPLKDRPARAVDELLMIASKPGVRESVRAFVDGETPQWFGKFKPKVPLTGSGEKEAL